MNKPWSDVSKLELEVEALRKAKAENDERFQLEIGALRKERDELKDLKLNEYSLVIEALKQERDKLKEHFDHCKSETIITLTLERDAYREALYVATKGLTGDRLEIVNEVLAKYKGEKL